jgi:hypothetical protein
MGKQMAIKKTAAKPGAKKGAEQKKAPAMKYMQTRLTEASWKELQMLRLDQSGQSMQSLVVEALNDLMVKHGRKAVIAGPSEDEE